MARHSGFLHAAIGEYDRRYRAVMCADIVGFTRLMEAAELETFGRARSLFVAVIDPLVVAHQGELLKHTGDGFIALFESPLDALRCAVEVQAEVATQEREVPPERRMQLRIGLHWAPVILGDNDVFGSGVNLAARLQTAAPPAGTVVSGELAEQLGAVPGIVLQDIGLLVMKNVSRQLRAYLLASPDGARSGPQGLATRKPGRARLPSVAVMPFTDASPDQDGSYFAEGFVEDIILTLSNIPEILVVARGSTLALRRQLLDPARVSAKLGVRYILSGSVRRLCDRLRISIEFTDAAAASVIWAERFELAKDEIFALQDEIAIKVVSKIATSVRRTEAQRALRKQPRSLNAYDYLLRGLDLMYRMDYPSFAAARGTLERAIEEDRDYAAPYAFLAQWHVFSICEGWSIDAQADAAQMVRLAEAAMERDTSNALAMAVQGHGKGIFFGDRDAAIDLADRAIAASPNSSWAWIYGAIPCGFVGQAGRGIERAEHAIRLSPLDLQAFFNYCVLAQDHYLNGDLVEAIRWARRSVNLNPRFGNAIRVLAASLVAAGEGAEAALVARHHREVLPGFRVADYRRRCPFPAPQADLYTERLRAAGIPE